VPLVFVTGRDLAAFPLEEAAALGPIDLLADPALAGYTDLKLSAWLARRRALPSLAAAGPGADPRGEHAPGDDQRLRESEARLRLATEAAGLGVWMWDPLEDRAIWEDERLYEIFGVERASGPIGFGRFLSEFVEPEDAGALRAQAERALAAAGRIKTVCRIRRRSDRALRWVEVTARPHAMGDGRRWFLGTLADVTEFKAAEAALRRSDELYRTVIESMDEGFCLVDVLFDAAGEPFDYRFLETNAAFVEQTGLRDAVGRTVRELVPEHEAHWCQAYGRVARSGEPMRFVNEAQGLGRWYDVYATRLGGPGSRKVAILFSDITARRRTEEELRRLAEELALADRRKNEFLATLAHELRNPLAPLRNGLRVMRVAADNPRAVASARDMMERQLAHMVHLVDDLLDVARIRSGKLELRPLRIELKTVVASAVETSLPQVEAGRHELAVELPPHPVWLHADPVRLSQVLGNLLNNAARYTPEGGRIVVAARLDGPAAVEIAVRDNGIGIVPELLPDVFDMFAQGGRSPYGGPGGLGIGLALVRRLVEQHGGSVGAESAGPGQGSVFRVRLPVAEVAPQPAGRSAAEGAAPTGPAAQPDGTLRVLVADDNADSADSLALLLQAEGHALQVAHDGTQALRIAQAWRPDVAILDIGMPGMSGHEVARALRRTPGLERTLLLALTGWGTEADHARSADSGFDLHLTKPVDPLQVVRLLAGLVPSAAGPER
jgi:PAS domain S-box-containing protein